MHPVEGAALTIGSGKWEVLARFRTPADASVVADVQLWLDQYPDLRPGQTFFIGMWPTTIMATDEGLCVGEYDFGLSEYVPRLERCMTLWVEQDRVCRSRDLVWHSIQPNSLLWVTPSVTHAVGVDLIEGVHDRSGIAPGSQAAGWFIYTNDDRDSGKDWEPMPMIDALTRLDMQVLRFLGVPDGWTFHINKDQQTWLWSQEEEDEAGQAQATSST